MNIIFKSVTFTSFGIMAALVLSGVLLGGPAIASAEEGVIKAINPEVAAAYNGQSNTRYTMRPGDQLQLTVYGHDDLSTRVGTAYTPYVVRTDGYLTVPLIGDVLVNGKTVEAVTNEISQRLSKYILKPRVSINITKMGTTRVYVLGEIQHQGAYELDKDHRLMDAIAMAGGFTEYSAKKKVFVIRGGSQEASMMINFSDLLRTGNPEANIMLYEGDCVYMTSNGKFVFSKDVLPWLSAVNAVADTRYKLNNTNN